MGALAIARKIVRTGILELIGGRRRHLPASVPPDATLGGDGNAAGSREEEVLGADHFGE